MKDALVGKSFTVQGMSCHSCERAVEAALLAVEGVASARASFAGARVDVEYDPGKTGPDALARVVESRGYPVGGRKGLALLWSLLIAALVVGAYATAKTGGLLGKPSMSLAPSLGMGALFAVGLLTSVHCLGMCGGIMLTQTAFADGDASNPGKRCLVPSLRYNGGRVLSYTAAGGLIGLLGATMKYSASLRGGIVLVSGALVLLAGVAMFGLIPRKGRPRRKAGEKLGSRLLKTASDSGPFTIGLLTVFLPCGPLQAAELYALGTGSAWGGAGAMLAFSLGTAPLMIAAGTVSGVITKKHAKYMVRASAAIIIVMGGAMIGKGLSISGIGWPRPAETASMTSAHEPVIPSGAVSAAMEGAFQVVHTVADANGYTTDAQVLRRGVPVRWIVDGRDLDVSIERIVIPKLKISAKLKAGENVVEFTPEDCGLLVYSSWMGTITDSFTVVESR